MGPTPLLGEPPQQPDFRLRFFNPSSIPLADPKPRSKNHRNNGYTRVLPRLVGWSLSADWSPGPAEDETAYCARSMTVGEGSTWSVGLYLQTHSKEEKCD
jgi:hypothetical protein